MEKLENLTLSENKMDTKMAMEFIKSDTTEWPGNAKFLVETNPNEIQDNEGENVLPLFNLKPISNRKIIGKQLAKKIEENVEMFVQLEHIARGTDPHEVRNGHMKLMSQIMQCSDVLWNHVQGSSIALVVTEDTPLYILGALAAVHLYLKELNHRGVICVTDRRMKHLCQFFVKLCRNAGLDIVVVYGELNDRSTLTETYTELIVPADITGGCTGVISAWSDMDSALDAFINSSLTAPWRLKQVYVQESVFDDFKNVLASRVRGPTALHHCLIDGKIFAVEALSNPTDATTIPVRAYRTNKELLTLIDTPYLSLWATNSAEANEIALKTQAADVVWINEYASFDGPSRAALPFYKIYTNIDLGIPDEALKIAQSWSQLKTSKRLEIVTDYVKEREGYANVPQLLENWRSDDFVHITDTTICYGVQVPIGTYICNYSGGGDDKNIFNALVNGILAVSCNGDDRFLKAGIPLLNWNVTKYNDLRNPIIAERFKVIRTNYGTIFVN